MKQVTRFIALLLVVLGSPLFAQEADETLSNPWIVMRAIVAAYPDRIQAIEYDLDIKDWYMVIGTERLYWANGRLLPLAEINDWAKWRPYVDYLYPKKVPDPALFTAETIASLNHDVLTERRNNSPVFHIAFFDLMYDGKTRRSIESHITRFDYLGLRVSMHTRMVEPLRRIEKRLNELAGTDAEVEAFLKSLLRIEGYNWREIGDRPNLSHHSWGIAIDFLPKNWGQKNIYWNWISYWNDKWMLTPPDRRWSPPDAVIAVFEEEGFIWGGKWLLWDTMHFEYRPELLVLQKWGYFGENGQ